jgi:hypothetical protein
MIKKSIQIDNRQYERELERKGNYRIGYSGKKNRHNKAQASREYGDPMELDATQKKGYTGNREYRRKRGLCYHCGKPGHQVKNCHKQQSGQALEKRDTPKRSLHATFKNKNERNDQAKTETEGRQGKGPTSC